MGYAFISYSSLDKATADAIHNLFSRHNIETWMAPNDIPVGSRYAQVISKALKDCACLVLLLTNASQGSTWVAKELERAIHYQKVIIPIQLENLVLNDEFEYYISTDQLVFVSKLAEDSPEIQRILYSVSACVAHGPSKSKATCDAAKTVPAAPEPPVDPWECYRQGYACEFGTDRPVNYAEAVNWYLKAANQGNAWAQHRLGECYYAGKGVAQDFQNAVKWYTLSANNNDKSGQYCLGFCYEFGKGVAVDLVQARFWYEKAAEQGHSWAQHRLGECYYYGRGVARNPEKAFFWLKCAAEQNNSGVYPLLAQCYEFGFGVEQNTALAHYWRTRQS